jgi:hypothetical protein
MFLLGFHVIFATPFTTDSGQAKKYNFRSSTNVMLDQELISLDVSTDKGKMKDFLSKKMQS